MKLLLATIGLIATGAVGTGVVCYRLNCDPALRAAVAKGDAMAWLRADFHLTDAQFAAIRELHAAYAPSCEEHCRLIREATEARDIVKATGMRGEMMNHTGTMTMPASGDPTALAAAEQKLRELHATCEAALTAHMRAVAALMSPEDGRRYLDLLLPKVADFDHAATPDLQLNPH